MTKIYLWPETPNQPLNIKIGRETKLKNVDRDIAKKLTPEIVELIDNVLSKAYIQKKTQPQENLQQNLEAIEAEEQPSPELVSVLPKGFLDKWKALKESPENFDLKSFWFKKTWRYLGAKGRWVYVYCLWSLEEMVKRRARRRVIQGYLIDPPISIIDEPLAWEEWERQAVKEYKERGFKMTPERYKRMQRYYKRLPKEKVLALVFVPTWTTEFSGSVIERTSELGKLVSISFFVLSRLEDATKIPVYQAIARTSQAEMTQMAREVTKLTQQHGEDQQMLRKTHQQMLRTRTPIMISTEGTPFPKLLPEEPLREPPKREKFKLKAGQPEDILNLVFILLGISMLVWGLAASEPIALVGGLILAMIFSIIWMRRKKSVKLPEPVEERVEEAAQIAKGD